MGTRWTLCCWFCIEFLLAPLLLWNVIAHWDVLQLSGVLSPCPLLRMGKWTSSSSSEGSLEKNSLISGKISFFAWWGHWRTQGSRWLKDIYWNSSLKINWIVSKYLLCCVSPNFPPIYECCNIDDFQIEIIYQFKQHTARHLV